MIAPVQPKGPPHKRNMQSAPRGVRPNLPARRPAAGGETAEVACGRCGAWRPAFCISETKAGWIGDCCVSALRRAGRGAEVD